MKKLFNIIPFICVCISLMGSPVFAASDPAQFIENLAKDALKIVNDKGLTEDRKRDELSTYINKYLDVERIAKAVFARCGYKELSDDDKNKVNEFLKKYLLNFYAGKGKLSAMVDATLVDGTTARAKESDFAVTTKFKKGSTEVTIVWVTDGQKIYYVEIEGINQIITLRSEMEAAVGSGGLMAYINK